VDEGPVPAPLTLPGLDDSAGLWHSDLLVSGEGGGPLLAISTPLLHLDGSRGVGRLVAWVDAEAWVRSSLENLSGGGRGSPTVVRIEDQVGRSLTLQADRSRRLEFETRPGVSPPLPLGVRDRGLAIGENDWVVHVQLHTAKAFEAVSGFQSRVFGIGIILALLCAGLLFFPMHFLVRPLGELLKAAKRIRSGDYAVRVAIETEDEVGDLGRSFNHMAESVELQTNKLKRAAEDLRSGQRELRTQHERLATVIRSLRDGLVVLDPDGRPVLSNDAAKPLLSVLEKADEQVTSHFLCREGAESRSCSSCLLHPEGPTSRCVLDVGSRVFEVHGTELPPDPNGRRGRVLIARDITERVAQDEQDVHRERLSVLGEVAAVMAHELNNPLTSIRMFAQMMEDGLPEDSPYHEHTGVIVRNTETCRQTIRELLGYASASAPQAAPVDVHDVIEDVVRFVRPLAERAGADLETRLDAADAVVHGDEVQIRQVLVNLVLNAVQGADGKHVCVCLSTRAEDGVLSVDVSDTGPGVPEELRERIFDAFFSTKPRGVGTGLGLPTARRIAELHGGGVDLIDGRPGQTTFRLRLRTLAQNAAAPDGAAAQEGVAT